ncbi:MAG TPA: DNA-directed RNA polymerase subunit beta, partial [Bacillota bacterium]
RVKTYEAIVKGENVPEPGVPESFKVLIKELQSLGLDVKVLSEEAKEIQIKEDDDDVKEMAKELGLEYDTPRDTGCNEEIEEGEHEEGGNEAGGESFDEEDDELFEESFEDDHDASGDV